MEKAEVRTWLAVGGLLHDIGKLIDRSGKEGLRKRKRGSLVIRMRSILTNF